MSDYEKVDDKYFQALCFGDDFCDAKIYPDTVWQKYQELLEEIRQVRAGLA